MAVLAGVPERPKGAGCKPAGSAYEGSNPSPCIISSRPSAAPTLAAGRLDCTRLALLAQLVEHLHGKEGVDGSSPSEGSAKAPQIGAFCAHEDLHDLQRAVVWSPPWSLQVEKRPQPGAPRVAADDRCLNGAATRMSSATTAARRRPARIKSARLMTTRRKRSRTCWSAHLPSSRRRSSLSRAASAYRDRRSSMGSSASATCSQRRIVSGRRFGERRGSGERCRRQRGWESRRQMASVQFFVTVSEGGSGVGTLQLTVTASLCSRRRLVPARMGIERSDQDPRVLRTRVEGPRLRGPSS